MKKILPLLPALALLASCDTDLLDDPSFDVWCGESLCSWEVEVGDVEKVPTWHSADYGVSLVGEEVILSQHIEATQDDLKCLRFRLMANISEEATVSLKLDFLDDGTDEYSHPVTSDDFQESSYLITPPSWFQGVRLSLHKEGDGEAVLGQIRALATDAESCLDAPVVLNDRPDGAPCEEGAQCTGGYCPEVEMISSGGPYTMAVCSTCAESTDCDSACGVTAEAPTSYSHLTCEAAGEAVLGTHCATDEECGAGICHAGQCSECWTDAECGGEDTCEGDDMLQPHRCVGALRASGEACFANSDCDSGVCSADQPVRVCDTDGRDCDTSADCLWEELGAQCVQIGAIGTCT